MDAIRIHRAALNALERHARAAFPQECCGALLGPGAGAEHTVLRGIELENENRADPEHHFRISAATLLRTEREAEAHGLTVLGFYHSHPTEAAAPSPHDREQAWPGYVYVIIPAPAGAPGPPRAWRLDPDRARFHELRVLVEEEMV